MLYYHEKCRFLNFPPKDPWVPSGPSEAGIQNPTVEGQSGGQDESIDTPNMASALSVKPPRLQNKNNSIDVRLKKSINEATTTILGEIG